MDLYIHKPIKLRNLFIAKPDISSDFVLRKPSSFLLGFPLLANEVINLPYNQIHGQKLKSVAYLVAKYFGDKSKPSDFSRLLNLFLSSESYKQQLEYKANIYYLASLLDKVGFYEYALSNNTNVTPLLSRQELYVLDKIISDPVIHEYFDSQSLEILFSFYRKRKIYNIFYDFVCTLVPLGSLFTLFLILSLVQIVNIFKRSCDFQLSQQKEVVLSKWASSMPISTSLGEVNKLGSILSPSIPQSYCRIFHPLYSSIPEKATDGYRYKHLSLLRRIFALSNIPLSVNYCLLLIILKAVSDLCFFHFYRFKSVNSSLFDLIYAFSSASFISPGSLYITYNDNSLFSTIFNSFLLEKGCKTISYSHTFQSYGMFTCDGNLYDWDRSFRITNTQITGPSFLVEREISNSLLAENIISCDFIPARYRMDSSGPVSLINNTRLQVSVFLASCSPGTITDINSFKTLFTVLEKLALNFPFLSLLVKAKSYSHVDYLMSQSNVVSQLFNNSADTTFSFVSPNQPALDLINESDIVLGMPFSSPVIDGLSLSKPSYFVDLSNCWNNSFFSNLPNICITSFSQLETLFLNAYSTGLMSEQEYILKIRSLLKLPQMHQLESVQDIITKTF